MSASSIGLSVLIGVFVAILVVAAWLFDRQRREAEGRLDELEIKFMAERLGVKLDCDRIAETMEGGRLLNAIKLCNLCAGLDECHAFLEDEAAKADSITAFCPNAIYLLGLNEMQKREAEVTMAAWPPIVSPEVV
jgi:hypothetical protein